MERPLTYSVQPPTTLAILCQQAQQTSNNVLQDSIRYLDDCTHLIVQVFSNAPEGINIGSICN